MKYQREVDVADMGVVPLQIPATGHPLQRGAGRIVVIDSLRGLAALLVLGYHAAMILTITPGAAYRMYGFRPNLNACLHYTLIPLLSKSGYVGVMIFFALSGYCIHRTMARKLAVNDGRFSLRMFYLRRLWRIYPVYLTALLLTAAVDHWRVVHGYIRGHVEPSNPISLRSFFVNVLTLQEIAGPTFGSNGVLWTLGIEMHFYLVYPLLYWLSRSRGPSTALLMTFTVSAASIIFAHHFNIHARTFPQFWFCWGCGFYAAEYAAGRAWLPTRTLMALGAFAGVAALLIHFSPFVRWAELVAPVATTGLLLAALTPRGIAIGQTAVGRALAAQGIFSYSLYATHYPVLLLLRSLRWPTTPPVSIVPVFVGGLLCIAVAFVCYLLVERWTLSLPRFQRTAELAAPFADAPLMPT